MGRPAWWWVCPSYGEAVWCWRYWRNLEKKFLENFPCRGVCRHDAEDVTQHPQLPHSSNSRTEAGPEPAAPEVLRCAESSAPMSSLDERWGQPVWGQRLLGRPFSALGWCKMFSCELEPWCCSCAVPVPKIGVEERCGPHQLDTKILIHQHRHAVTDFRPWLRSSATNLGEWCWLLNWNL